MNVLTRWNSADHDVHASSCGIGNKKEAGSRTKDEDSDDMSRFQSLLDDWTSKQRAAHPTTGTGGATITQEMILKTLQNISDKWQKHATILPKGERILHHFSWQPTDDLVSPIQHMSNECSSLTGVAQIELWSWVDQRVACELSVW